MKNCKVGKKIIVFKNFKSKSTWEYVAKRETSFEQMSSVQSDCKEEWAKIQSLD